MAFAAVNAAGSGEIQDNDTKMFPKPRYKSYRYVSLQFMLAGRLIQLQKEIQQRATQVPRSYGR